MNKLHFFSVSFSTLLVVGNTLQTSNYLQANHLLAPTKEQYEKAIEKVYNLNINTVDKKKELDKEIDEVGSEEGYLWYIKHTTSVSFYADHAMSRGLVQNWDVKDRWFPGGEVALESRYGNKNIRWNIITFELPRSLKLEDFPIITFNNKKETSRISRNLINKKPYSKASWGSWSYNGSDVKQTFDKKNIFEIGANYPATTYEDVLKYTNTYLLRKTDKYSLASVNLKIDVGINYFTYKNQGYLQFLTYFSGETWTSASGGNLWMSWGSSFGLWKKETAKYLID